MRCAGPTPPRPDPLGRADRLGRRDAGRAGAARRRARLSRQRPNRAARAGAGATLRHRAQDHGRGIVRGKGARPGHAQQHRRRRCLHRHLGKYHLPQSRRGENDRLVAAGGGRTAHGRSLQDPGRHDSRNNSESRWIWQFGQDQTVHLPANCILIRRDGLEIPIEDSVAPIHDREGQADRGGHRFPRRERGSGDGAADDPFGRARLSDRLAQSNAAERPDQPGDRLGAASQETSRGAVSGFGRLQTHQRLAGTSDRRQASSIHRKTPGGLRPRLGHGQPAGRRRIRRAAFGSRTSGRCRHYGEKNAAGGGASLIPSTSTIFTSPQASASASIPTMAWMRRRSSRTRTPRCTRPRKMGARAISFSSRR